MADFVIPVTPNMIDAARANNSLPCYEIQFEEIGANGQRQCRYKQFKETMPNGKSYAVLDIKDLPVDRSEEHTSELQSLMRSSYAVFRLKTKTQNNAPTQTQDKHTINT